MVTLHADDVMDSPRPRIALSKWQRAPGRTRVTLAVPGALLRGYSYRGSVRTAPVLVAFGGSGNLIFNHDRAMRGFARDTSRVLWYDYRGYGFSSGTAHFDLLCADALRIFDAAAKSNGGARHVVVLGYSMGTAVADYVAVHRPVRALILAAPWNDYVATAEYEDPKHTYRLDPHARQMFDETAMLARVKSPLLVFQGTLDDAIPPVEGGQLERGAASPDKQFVSIVGAKHNGLLENPASQAAVKAFIASLR